jgi:excisionase family DNA binding protein
LFGEAALYSALDWNFNKRICHIAYMEPRTSTVLFPIGATMRTRTNLHEPRSDAARYPLLTTTEVARLLALSEREVRLMAECQEIPALKIGRKWRFRPADLDCFLSRSLTRAAKA